MIHFLVPEDMVALSHFPLYVVHSISSSWSVQSRLRDVYNFRWKIVMEQSVLNTNPLKRRREEGVPSEGSFSFLYTTCFRRFDFEKKAMKILSPTKS